ncbi:MAG: polysaccharide biosynthesis tyrosine autokinase [bacterium]
MAVKLMDTTDQKNEEGFDAIKINYVQTKIANVGEDTLRNNRLMAFFDDTPFSDQYKILRTQILQIAKKEDLKTLLVTSPISDEGKSLTAANLAISFAKELHQTVLLVDGDLKAPSLHTLFDLHPSLGLSDYLVNQKSLSDILVAPGIIEKLTVLCGRASRMNSAEILGSSRMKELVQEMKDRYKDRYIIFDSAPLLGCADTLILSEYVDGIILVVEYGNTQRYQVDKALHLLAGKNVIGTILNKSPMHRKQTYY